MYYIKLILFLLYKIILAVPSTIILIALLKLNKKFKSIALRLAIIGKIGILVHIIVLSNVYEFLVKKGIVHSNNIDKVSMVLLIYSIIFSLIFAVGFFLFVKELIKVKEEDIL